MTFTPSELNQLALSDAIDNRPRRVWASYDITEALHRARSIAGAARLLGTDASNLRKVMRRRHIACHWRKHLTFVVTNHGKNA